MERGKKIVIETSWSEKRGKQRNDEKRKWYENPGGKNEERKQKCTRRLLKKWLLLLLLRDSTPPQSFSGGWFSLKSTFKGIKPWETFSGFESLESEMEGKADIKSGFRAKIKG